MPSQIASAVEAVALSVESLKVTLRAYQEFGIKYAVLQERTILGDEMGLGKTIQALGVAVHAAAAEDAEKFLVVAPASILGNWEREIESRTQLTFHMLHGKHRDSNFRRWRQQGGIALTSFSTLRSLPNIENSNLDLLIVDEAHYVKNPEAMRSKSVAKTARGSKRVLLMSGTPLENRAGEFVNLISICDKNLAKNLEVKSFENSILAPKEFETSVARVYLRRNQEDVLTELPEVLESEEWVTLSAEEWKLYDEGVSTRNIMGLRQAANGSADHSSKMNRLQELITVYRNENRKAVIFSYFRNTLSMIEQTIGEHFRLDGSVPAGRRMQIVDEFNRSNEWSALISQIDVGGVGLNLQSASVAILVEPQFKPTTEWQAIKRIHRMGQTQKVNVHRLLAVDTIDERLQELTKRKSIAFDDYARESAIKSASYEASDASEPGLINRILELETSRSRQRRKVQES